MKQLLSREELIPLVQRLLDTDYNTEEEGESIIKKVENGVIDPYISSYIFWPKEEMKAEQIVDKALAYKPIIL